jgi:NAD(P)H-flavin reductase
MQTMPARLLDRTEIAPEVLHFVFEATQTPDMKFVPGQFVALSDTIGEKRITRAYSIASEPFGNNRYELCINLVHEGKFTPRLFTLQPGDTITMNLPLGGFIMRQPVRDSVMIATGTGVAPFRSMLRAWYRETMGEHPRFDLLFGVRHEPHLYYRAEFEEMAAKHTQFHFWPTVTRPEPSYQGRSGRVTAHLDEVIAGRRDIDIYLCGLKEMVNDVRKTLYDQGFDKSQVRYERYD